MRQQTCIFSWLSNVLHKFLSSLGRFNKMSGCSKTSKALLCFLSFVFWAASAALFYVGIVVFNTYSEYKHLSTANLTLIPASIVLGVAVFMFIIGLIGCIAAARESKCLLAVFFSLVLVVLCAEIAAAALGYAYRKDVKKAVEDGLSEAIHSNDTEQLDQIDYIQKQLECCGVHNDTDWVNTPYWDSHNGTLPESCCPNEDCNGTAVPSNPNVFQQGCYDLLEKDFLDNLGYVGGGALGLAVLQIFGLICTCILICRSRRKKVPYLTLGTDQGGLQV